MPRCSGGCLAAAVRDCDASRAARSTCGATRRRGGGRECDADGADRLSAWDGDHRGELSRAVDVLAVLGRESLLADGASSRSNSRGSMMARAVRRVSGEEARSSGGAVGHGRLAERGATRGTPPSRDWRHAAPPWAQPQRFALRSRRRARRTITPRGPTRSSTRPARATRQSRGMPSPTRKVPRARRCRSSPTPRRCGGVRGIRPHTCAVSRGRDSRRSR